jgi:hypothetical protein
MPGRAMKLEKELARRDLSGGAAVVQRSTLRRTNWNISVVARLLEIHGIRQRRRGVMVHAVHEQRVR